MNWLVLVVVLLAIWWLCFLANSSRKNSNASRRSNQTVQSREETNLDFSADHGTPSPSHVPSENWEREGLMIAPPAIACLQNDKSYQCMTGASDPIGFQDLTFNESFVYAEELTELRIQRAARAMEAMNEI